MDGQRRSHARDKIALLRWLGRSAETALALVRRDRLALTNSFFRDLEASEGEWRWICGPHAQLRHPTLRQLACAEACDLLRQEEAVRICRFERGDLAVELRVERLHTATGPAVVVTAHDVSGELRSDARRTRDREARLHEERMHAMGVVASGLAHDLNHSLNVLALRIATLRADPRLLESRPTLEALSRVVEQAAGTVARLQDLARRRRDRPAELVDLSAVLLGAIEMARTDLDGRSGRVRIAADVPPLPLVHGTAAELTHLFSDLLLNARDAMPAGGTVEVRAREHRGTAEVTVADRGRGIPEESLSHVFDPFFSGESRETGLVLSVAYGLMQRLGGNISAANRPGGGAIFTLAFPLASPPQRRDERRRREPRRVRVLLVDDESDNLEVLQELLQMEGHRVDTATSGRAALERFRRGERYDLVLCDVGMPEISGWQVVSELQRIAPGTRVWLLTGWANEISERDPRLADVRGVLGKPLDLERLRTLLSEAPAAGEHHASLA